MATLRVLVLNNFAPPLGGAEEHVARLLTLLGEAGHEARLLVPDTASGLGAIADRFHNRAFARRMRREIAAFAPDVVHVHNFMRRMGAAPFAVALAANVPSVLTVHDYQLMCPRTWAIRRDGTPCPRPALATCMFGGCRGSLSGLGRATYTANALRRLWIARRVGREATVITAPARALAERLERALDRPVEVLPYPFDTEAGDLPGGDPQAGDTRAAPPRDLVFVGRVAVEKGLEPLLVALAQVDGLALTIAGDGPALEALTARARDLGLGDRVRFLGRIDHDQVPATMARHGAVVAPSLWMDNSPLTIHEALTAGRPVLGSRRGGIPELVEDGVTGFVFEPEDRASTVAALRRYRDLDDGAYGAMGRAAAARARSFGGAAFLEQLLATYRAAMAQGART